MRTGKTWGLSSLFLTLLSLMATAATDYQAEVRAASARLLSNSRSPEGKQSDFAGLVDLLGSMAREEAALPQNARTRILEAADSFRANPSLEGPGPAALGRAWRELSGGRAFTFPPEVRDISQATKQVQVRIDGCLAALGSGDRARAIRDLLEALLMIATPMEAAENR